ncbi:hypothetical protein SUDANB9_05994 [Streptomyces sp. enrichment culture]
MKGGAGRKKALEAMRAEAPVVAERGGVGDGPAQTAGDVVAAAVDQDDEFVRVEDDAPVRAAW